MISKKLFAFAAVGILIPSLALAADDACSMSLGDTILSPEHWGAYMDDFSANSECRKGMRIVEAAKETHSIRSFVQSHAGIYNGSGVQVYPRGDYAFNANGFRTTRAEVTLFPNGNISMSVDAGLGWNESHSPEDMIVIKKADAAALVVMDDKLDKDQVMFGLRSRKETNSPIYIFVSNPNGRATIYLSISTGRRLSDITLAKTVDY